MTLMEDNYEKFGPSFTTAPHCDFDLIKLWDEAATGILIRLPKNFLLHPARLSDSGWSRPNKHGFDVFDAELVLLCVADPSAFPLIPGARLSLFVLSPSASGSLTSILTSFCRDFLFVPSVSYFSFCVFSCWTLVFSSAGVRAGNAISLLHLHLHISGKHNSAAVGT